MKFDVPQKKWVAFNDSMDPLRVGFVVSFVCWLLSHPRMLTRSVKYRNVGFFLSPKHFSEKNCKIHKLEIMNLQKIVSPSKNLGEEKKQSVENLKKKIFAKPQISSKVSRSASSRKESFVWLPVLGTFFMTHTSLKTQNTSLQQFLQLYSKEKQGGPRKKPSQFLL